MNTLGSYELPTRKVSTTRICGRLQDKQLIFHLGLILQNTIPRRNNITAVLKRRDPQISKVAKQDNNRKYNIRPMDCENNLQKQNNHSRITRSKSTQSRNK